MKSHDAIEISMDPSTNNTGTASGSQALSGRNNPSRNSSAAVNPASKTEVVGTGAVVMPSGIVPSSVGEIQQISRRYRGNGKKGLRSPDDPPGPGGFGIQFTLGDGDDAAEEGVVPSVSHPLFCEMEELRPARTDGSLEWKETARWIKFEEDVEEGGNRWSKPFVATLPLHCLLELRTCLLQGAMILDAEVPVCDCLARRVVKSESSDVPKVIQWCSRVWEALPALCDLIINEWISRGILQDYHRDQVRDLLLRRHRHQFEGLGDHKTSYAMRQLSGLGRSISHGIFSMTHLSDATTGAPPGHATTAAKQGEHADRLNPERRESRSHVPNVMSAGSMFSSEGSDGTMSRTASRANLHFSKKLPVDAESATILVGEVEFVLRPVCAFVRVCNHVCLGNLTEVNIPTRFIFLLLGPVGNAAKFHEIGRAMGALCSDEVFQHHLYKARFRKEIIDGIDEFLNDVTVLPPGEWDPQIRIEPPKKLPSQNSRKKSPEDSVTTSPSHSEKKEEEVQVRRTGRAFGGLVEDIRKKAKFYASDFRDGFAVQSIASVIFLYFATLTPVVAFGAVLGQYTHNDMAAMESIMSAAIVGILWALFSGQPLIIMGSTGPVLIFEQIVTRTCEDYGLEYLPLRFWIGIWTGIFLFIMVATDASYLVRYITRFTEEGFAALISFIFIFESLGKLIGIRKTRNVCTYPMDCPRLYDQCQCNISMEILDVGESNVTKSWCKRNGGILFGPGCSYTPDVLFFSVILFFGTYFLASKLKEFRNEPFFRTKVRQTVSDFAVTFAIIFMSVIDFYLDLDTPKLAVPSGLTPTRPDRSWIVHPFGKNPWWTSLAAIAPALFGVILIFMDQQITAVIVNRHENKLKKGCGYHLDLLVLTISVVFCAVMGLPWMVAATVLSINHVNSLKLESEVKAPGEAPQFESVRENRLTTLCIYLLIAASVFMTPLLSRIPMPVLYGVFLFMGISALRGLQFVDRLSLLLMPMKYQPDYVYLRHVPIKRVHFFTLIQTICLALLWVIKSFDASSILFPVMVLALVGVRKLMDFMFRQKELALLDDLMPETTKRKTEDDSRTKEEKKKAARGHLVESESSAHVSVALPNGHVMKIPVTIPEESGERSRSVTPGALEAQLPRSEEKSPRSKRWTKTDKKKDPHSHQVLLPKSTNPVSVKPKHGQIPEEKDAGAPPSPVPFPVITICPATPRGSRVDLNKNA